MVEDVEVHQLGRTANVLDPRAVQVADVGRLALQFIHHAVAVVVQVIVAGLGAAVVVMVGIDAAGADMDIIRRWRPCGTNPQVVLPEIGGTRGGAVTVVDAPYAGVDPLVTEQHLQARIAPRLAGVGGRVAGLGAVAVETVVAVGGIQAVNTGVGDRVAQLAIGAVVTIQTLLTGVGGLVADRFHAGRGTGQANATEAALFLPRAEKPVVALGIRRTLHAGMGTVIADLFRAVVVGLALHTGVVPFIAEEATHARIARGHAGVVGRTDLGAVAPEAVVRTVLVHEAVTDDAIVHDVVAVVVFLVTELRRARVDGVVVVVAVQHPNQLIRFRRNAIVPFFGEAVLIEGIHTLSSPGRITNLAATVCVRSFQIFITVLIHVLEVELDTIVEHGRVGRIHVAAESREYQSQTEHHETDTLSLGHLFPLFLATFC